MRLNIGDQGLEEISICLAQRLAECLHAGNHRLNLIFPLNLRIYEEALVSGVIVHEAMISQGQA